MTAPARLQRLDWDSQWLGFPVGRFVAVAPGTAADVRAAIAQARAAGIRLLYLVLPPADGGTAAAAVRAGGQLVDHKRTYHLTVGASPPQVPAPVGVQLALATALTPALRTLALQSGEYSRFRCDARIGTAAFEELYTHWVGQALATGKVWVASRAGETAGLLAFAAHRTHASIELVAVAPTARRHGLGRFLVQAAQLEARRQGHATVQVVTQGANTPACALYERCGFQLLRTDEVYHLWL